MHPIADIRSAIGLLTLFPVGAVREDARPTAWLSWVGWILGAAASGMAWVVSLFDTSMLQTLVVAVLIVAAWAVASRLLHWDGLADTADAIWGGSSPSRRLEIMRDSRSGAFAIIGVVLVAFLQVSAVAVLLESHLWWTFVAAPVFGRLSATIASWTLTPARADGLGASVAGSPRPGEVIIAALSAVGTLTFFSVTRLAVVVFGVVLALLVPRFLARTVGGITGDTLGAGILLVETAVLVFAAMVGA
ncbi:MAG: adenosylcobinamide-GDP ribazoletransferase [Coriobacteriia bacterium]|nr:adenosylcobinamide-GDP ribazoletransferase [Coriobacteriia bacterium]MBN2823106.1 adenosylcobinamide-GDP ribazoletransferase [Coriobacteriia bacterium]